MPFCFYSFAFFSTLSSVLLPWSALLGFQVFVEVVKTWDFFKIVNMFLREHGKTLVAKIHAGIDISVEGIIIMLYTVEPGVSSTQRTNRTKAAA